MYYIAKDMLPLDTVSGEGFLHMVNKFEPRYKPPGRKALTNNSYFGCIFYYIIDDGHEFILKSRLPEVQNFLDSHTGTELQEVFSQWNYHLQIWLVL